jgi:hypothetical protein
MDIHKEIKRYGDKEIKQWIVTYWLDALDLYIKEKTTAKETSIAKSPALFTFPTHLSSHRTLPLICGVMYTKKAFFHPTSRRVFQLFSIKYEVHCLPVVELQVTPQTHQYSEKCGELCHAWRMWQKSGSWPLLPLKVTVYPVIILLLFGIPGHS